MIKHYISIVFIFFNIVLLSAQNIDSTHFSAKYYHRKSVFKAMPNKANEIVFLGNSITEQGPWIEMFQNTKIINRGIGGDTSDGILFRIEEITESKPEKIFLMIGTNDLKYNKSPDYIINKIKLIVEKIISQTSHTTIYLQSVLPTLDREERPISAIKEINTGLKSLADDNHVFYIDLFSHFANPKDNDQLFNYYTLDGLHLNGKAYLKWKELIQHLVNGNSTSLNQTLNELKNTTNGQAFVVAHRGDWRNAPENSIQAITNCIEMGIDFVEIDLSLTKDGEVVVIHGPDLDRTTNLKGNVADYTYQELKKARLRNGASYLTEHKLPNFKETLSFAKNKIFLDLDIKGDIPFYKIAEIIEEENAWKNVVFRSYRTFEEARTYCGDYLDKMIYFPAISEQTKNIPQFIQEYESTINPFVYVPKFESDQTNILNIFKTIKTNGDRIWVHTISSDRSGGHNDDRAVYDLEGSYGWLINQGVSIFQTDRPKLLLQYLKARELHH